MSGPRGEDPAGDGEETNLYQPEPSRAAGPPPARPAGRPDQPTGRPAGAPGRPGAPSAPPPAAESFRPSGPPPPAESFRPAAPPPGAGRPAGVGGAGGAGGPGYGPARPGRAGDETMVTPRRQAGGALDGPGTDRLAKHPPERGGRLDATAAYDPLVDDPSVPGQPRPRDDFAGSGPLPPGVAPTAGQAPPRRRRRGRIMIISLVGLLVLLLVADRVGVVVAKDQMRKQIKESIAASEGPNVAPPTIESISINGFPFLTQVLFGKLKDIRLTLDGIPTPGPRISRASARLQGLHVPFSDAIRNKVGKVPVDKVSATVTMNYADLNAYLAKSPPPGLTQLVLKPADGGKQVAVSALVTKAELDSLGVPVADVVRAINAAQDVGSGLGQLGNSLGIPLPGGLGGGQQRTRIDPNGPYPVSGTTRFQVVDNKLTLKLTSLTFIGITVPGLSVLPELPVPLPVSGLPFSLVITDAHSTATGIEVAASARNVVLPAAK